jgi:DNA-binding response OmpR family regulator
MIVGDQALIASSPEAYLEETGIDVCDPLSSLAEALEWLATNTPSVAILDYSLRDGTCTTIVRLVQKRGVPFVIYSGYERDVAPVSLRNVPWLTKPCDRAAIRAALTLLITPAHLSSAQPSPHPS